MVCSPKNEVASITFLVGVRRPASVKAKYVEHRVKSLTAFCAITGLLLGGAAAEDRIERIDLTRFTCKQFLELNRDDALVMVGWRQGHYLLGNVDEDAISHPAREVELG
jgi:HdeA/HdeB family protein